MKNQSKRMAWMFIVAAVIAHAGCMGPGGEASGDCARNPIDATQYVIIGFWKTTDCSGDPIAQNAFPIDDSTGCYCWPGHSGENSAKNFICDKAAGTFTYDQSTDLVCETHGAHKESSLTECRQDVPPTLYSRILDLSACP